MDTTQNCPICQGRGTITDSNGNQKKCSCSVQRELKLYLQPVIQYKLVKTIDFETFNQSLHIKGGTDFGFLSLVKSYLFLHYFNRNSNLQERYTIETGSSIIEAYLNNNAHTQNYTIPLLFLDLTKFYNNKAMGDVVLYTLQQRQLNQLPYWVYTGNLKVDDVTMNYCAQLQEHLFSIQSINIDKFSEKVSKMK